MPRFYKEKIQRTSTCNRLDLETLGPQPIMPKSLPGYMYVGHMQKDLKAHMNILPGENTVVF